MGYKPITSLEDRDFTIKERVEKIIEKSNCEQNKKLYNYKNGVIHK